MTTNPAILAAPLGGLKQALAEELSGALSRAVAAGTLPAVESPALRVDAPRDPRHGDFASNLAMALAKAARRPPMAIAEALVAQLPPDGAIASAMAAAPGFLNLTVGWPYLRAALRHILEAGDDYGKVAVGKGDRVLLEFVSPNPTGPLHVGHGRWAALGSSLADLLAWAGHEVARECYVNDAGNQMELLGRSVAARYCELVGSDAVAMPEDGYQGAYIGDVARQAREELGAELEGVTHQADGGQALASRLRAFAHHRIMAHQQQVLARMGTRFDRWSSEKDMRGEGDRVVHEVVALLQRAGVVEEREGALWFLTTRFGDDKDRVLRKTTGEYTYLAPDIAYHWDKFRRADHLIDILGADHHGYTKRIKAALAVQAEVCAPGLDDDTLVDCARIAGSTPEQVGGRLEVIIGQLVTLFRNGEPVRMSKRTGEMVTLEELIDEVGADATRYFLVARSADSPIDFDLELAKRETADNPVFYVQYAHARICSILRLADEQGIHPASGPALGRLEHPSERTLVLKLATFPDEVAAAAEAREPHRIARYAQELATEFHAFYTNCRVIDREESDLSAARLALCLATRQVLRNALTGILGISCPERM